MKKSLSALFIIALITLSLSFVMAESGSGTGGTLGASASVSTSSSSNTGSSDTTVSTTTTTDAQIDNSGSKTKTKERTEARTEVREERKEKMRERVEERKEQRIETREEIRDVRGEKIAEFRTRIREKDGELRIEGKHRIRVKELSPEQREILAGRINAKTGLNLTADDLNNKTILRAELSNGRHADVKIMPDRASAVALQRLRAKCVERNCTVELKEVGKGNSTRLAYEVMTDKDSRVFFMFKKKMAVRASVDAETGELILAKKPWWAFMAKEKHAAEAEIESDVGASAGAEAGTDTSIGMPVPGSNTSEIIVETNTSVNATVNTST